VGEALGTDLEERISDDWGRIMYSCGDTEEFEKLLHRVRRRALDWLKTSELEL